MLTMVADPGSTDYSVSAGWAWLSQQKLFMLAVHHSLVWSRVCQLFVTRLSDPDSVCWIYFYWLITPAVRPQHQSLILNPWLILVLIADPGSYGWSCVCQQILALLDWREVLSRGLRGWWRSWCQAGHLAAFRQECCPPASGHWWLHYVCTSASHTGSWNTCFWSPRNGRHSQTWQRIKARATVRTI